MAEIDVPGPDRTWDPDSSPGGSGSGGWPNGELIGGRYRVVELIGRGGMGRVWRGRDETLERDVAVKEVMFPQGISADQRAILLQRVLREARAAAQLNHPGIITVHDVVEHAGAPVIVMEYVAGMSLAAAIEQSGGLPVRRVAEIGAAILRALSRAHAAGIIHRDLKPDNVLLMDDRVIITDFGIAHMVDSTMALTHTGTLIGTPAYMAPEQLTGQSPAPATDLWSLGATLYCAVEGEPPFSAETFTALCIAVVTAMPRPALRAEGLLVVLTGLLTKDPVQRAGAAQALAALEEVSRTGGADYVPTRVDTPPVPSMGPAGPGAPNVPAPARPNQPPPSPGYLSGPRPPGPPRSGPLLIGRAGVALILLAVGLVTALVWPGWLVHNPGPGKDSAMSTATTLADGIQSRNAVTLHAVICPNADPYVTAFEQRVLHQYYLANVEGTPTVNGTKAQAKLSLEQNGQTSTWTVELAPLSARAWCVADVHM
ncbi:serine/threonine-protein kinase [Streptomyces sp. G-G2]|uniref:serine/threonine-protein kinase n=1 Tax=Streptomyces sp. G-G2 TaxID=3046201 RepID=UPI0024BA4695|nr:serine/threonine-protein kinase [Streptomyces sp. G-G2]MDJ0384817.1 serine/threonine-protein kinase [Streptomyces sp. G-G2]